MDKLDIAYVHEIFYKYAKDCVDLKIGDREMHSDIKKMTEDWSEDHLRWALRVLCDELKHVGKRVLKESCPYNARS